MEDTLTEYVTRVDRKGFEWGQYGGGMGFLI